MYEFPAASIQPSTFVVPAHLPTSAMRSPVQLKSSPPIDAVICASVSFTGAMLRYVVEAVNRNSAITAITNIAILVFICSPFGNDGDCFCELRILAAGLFVCAEVVRCNAMPEPNRYARLRH
jgi:hypothetical protein